MASANHAANRAAAPDVQTVLDLPWLERTLLWSMRTWAAYHDTPQAVQRPLQQVFAEAGLSPAFQPFMQLMSCWFTGLRRLPDIRCVRCLRIGADERQLLAILSGDEPLHESLSCQLGRLMLPIAAQKAAAAALQLMQAITQAGLRFARTDAAQTEDWPPACQQRMSQLH